MLWQWAILSTLSPVTAIYWVAGPCAFTHSFEFEHCCCTGSLQDQHFDCWAEQTQVNWEICCRRMLKKCPKKSGSRLRAFYHWRRNKVANQTLAVYQRGKINTTLLDILNCEHQHDWHKIRIRLQTHDPVDLHVSAIQDTELIDLAKQLVNAYKLSSWKQVTEVFYEHFLLFTSLSSLDSQLPLPEDVFCFLGYISAAFVSAMAGAGEHLLLEIQSWFVEVRRDLEISSSTAWPIGFWDLALNQDRLGRLVTVIKPLAALVIQPRLAREAHAASRSQQLSSQEGRQEGLQLRRKIRAVTAVYHPSLDVEIVGFLLELFPAELEVTFAVWPENSSYSGGTLASHLCSLRPSWCSEPHSVFTLDEQFQRREADLSLCSLYWLCESLETWLQQQLPMVSLFGGCPVNSFQVRGGVATVAEELQPMWEYLERTPEKPNPAVLLSDAAFTSEFLHSYTGQLLPVYRPLAAYLWTFSLDKVSTVSKHILIPKTSSATPSGAKGWMVQLLAAFAGAEEVGTISERGTISVSCGTLAAPGSCQPLFVLQDGFLSWPTLSSFTATAYLPGPHSWVVSQWREMYNMNVPLLVPHREDLMCQSRYWIRRLWNDLRHVPEEAWMPKVHFWSQRHPFSPMPLSDDTADGVKAHMYWSQWLEFFTWPHVQFFRGLPDLIVKAKTLDFQAISEQMTLSNREATQEARHFWQGTLPVLLPNHVT